MFIDEAKISVNLHHANIVQVFDLGRIGEHYFIAMELVRGRDLLAIINRCRRLRRRLPLPIVLHVMAEVCTGLDYAHRCKVEGRPAGIIHRDVSPSNILVSWEGDVKVTDFGIAKASLKEHKTTTGTLKGKYGYMSPEQVMGLEIDHRSDIFAAGILMWESLMMRRLFKAETDLKTLELVKEARLPELPSSANRRVTGDVDEIVVKALARCPDDRFQTAGEMAEALRETLYRLGERIDSSKLSAFMKEIFSNEIEKEERKERDLSRPELLAMAGPAVEQFTTPPTRPDLPSSVAAQPRPGASPLSIAMLGTGLILLAGAIVVLVFWLANRPEVPRPPQQAATDTTDSGGTDAAASNGRAAVKGIVRIESRPLGAAVWLDGRDTGLKTPAELKGLDTSRGYSVELRLKGYREWKKEIDFAGAERLFVEAELVKKVAVPKRRKKEKPAVINISSIPVWGWVYIDGRKQAKPTPLFGVKLSPGVHRVRLENPRLGISVERKIVVRPGEKKDIIIELEQDE